MASLCDGDTNLEFEFSTEPKNITSLVEGDADPELGLSTECLLKSEVVNSAISEDHAYVRENIASAAILTLTQEYVAVVIIRTPYSRIQLRIQYPHCYPNETPIIELSSPTLPHPLLRAKEKSCLDIARQHIGKSQFCWIYEHVNSFIQNNLFVSCWKEMRQVAALCEGKGQLRANETEGSLHLRLIQGSYEQSIILKVHPMYPEGGVSIEFTGSNFPADIQYMFRSQAEEIVRRCVIGMSAEQALSGSNPIKMASAQKVTESAPKLTAGSIKSLKHDVTVLKQISELRVAATSSSKHTYSVQANAEKSEARKDLRRLAKAESLADEDREKQLKDIQQAKMQDLLRSKVSEVAQPSLLAVTQFLVDDFAVRLPLEPCQKCQAPAFPDDPASDALRNSRSSKRPLRTFCGHWLHYKCLDEWLTTPPFIRQCTVCERRIWHPG